MSYTRTSTKSGGILQAVWLQVKEPTVTAAMWMDLKAVPSIYTCRYCNAAMQTVLCGLLLVDFIITRS